MRRITPIACDAAQKGEAIAERDGRHVINTLFRSFENQRQGKQLETHFVFQAKRYGLLAIPNGQKVRWVAGGRMVTEKSQLDFTVLGPNQRVAFVDCKNTKGKTMPYSAFDARQVALAAEYGKRGFTAGFCVYFREPDAVGFYTAADLARVGPGKSVAPSERHSLGTLLCFDPRLLFTLSWT